MLDNSAVVSESDLGYWFYDETRPVQGRLLKTLGKLSKLWSIQLEYRAQSVPNTWTNIIHNTIGNDNGVVGNRIPGIWVKSSGELYISSAINGKDDYFVTVPGHLKLGQWYSINVAQRIWATSFGNKYLFEITIDGRLIHSIENTMPQDFFNVFVYASDPWYLAADGHIRNFRISIPKCKT